MSYTSEEAEKAAQQREVKERETDRILPQLFAKMQNNGHVNIDTDSMRTAYPDDRKLLTWFSRLTAEFVLEEREIWQPQVAECLSRTVEYLERTTKLDPLLENIREVSGKTETTVEALKELIVSTVNQVTEKEVVEVGSLEDEESTDNEAMDLLSPVLDREAERIFPKFYSTLVGNGGIRFNTDSMSLTDAMDRHYLSWLARLMAGFVLEEAKLWEKQLQEGVEVADESKTRIKALDEVLSQLQEAATKKGVTLEELQEIAVRYRTPLEAYYDKLSYKRQQREAMKALEEDLLEQVMRDQETGE